MLTNIGLLYLLPNIKNNSLFFNIKELTVSKKIGIIPARMESSRFPGKPMAKLHNFPMVGHVYLRSQQSQVLDDVYVATCNQEIYDFITNELKGKAVMTSSSHERATDRTAEAIEIIEKQTGEDVDLIVMIQGDEPMVTPRMIDTACKNFLEFEGPSVLNLYGKIRTEEEFKDENEIKVVLNKKKDRALYFSREPIPNFNRNPSLTYAYKQICIMPFKKDFLKLFNQLEPTELEKIESIDMLRLLEHGIDVLMAESPDESYSVDNEKDLQRVEKLMLNDELMKTYLR